jgi:hypothetical protein
MNSNQAKAIFESLVHGVDPHTGERLPQNTVVDKRNVMSALLAGVAALGLAAVRDGRNAAAPSNISKAWSEEEATAHG